LHIGNGYQLKEWLERNDNFECVWPYIVYGHIAATLAFDLFHQAVVLRAWQLGLGGIHALFFYFIFFDYNIFFIKGFSSLLPHFLKVVGVLSVNFRKENVY
jgi:hypothetical protein